MVDELYLFNIYDASYVHMATEIPCEKIGKKIKARLNELDWFDRETLNQEIIIAENGPSISEMDVFILEAVVYFCKSIDLLSYQIQCIIQEV